MSAANSNGFKRGLMRPGGNNRTVTLVVAGLLVISVLLFVNFWYVDGQRKELKDELEMLDNRYQSLQKNKRTIEANYESVNEKLKKLTLAKDKQVESAASLETSLNEVKKELEEAKTNKNEVDEKLKSLTDELAVQKEANAKLNASLQSTLEDLEKTKKKLEQNGDEHRSIKTTDSSIDEKMRVRQKLRETENLVNSRETDLLVKKVSEVEKQKPEGKRYQVSGEKKSVVADRLIANESRNSSSLSPTEESVRDTKENLSDVEEAPVLKRPKLDGEENQSNRSENAAFGGLAKFAEKQKEKVTDSDSVLKKPELSKSGGNEPADVIDKSVSEQENATFSSADNLEQSANLTDSEVLLPPKTNDNDHLAVRERVKNRSHVKKGSEERHSDRRHKVVGNNSTIAGKKQEKVKVDENEDYAGTGKKPRTEEAGPLEKKSEGLMTELNATKNVATEEKVTSLLDRVNKEENQLSEDKRKVAKRPPLRKGMDKSAAAETKGEDWAIQEAAEKLIKEQPKKDVGADENLNEDDTDSDTLDARKQIKTPNTADETDDAENDV